MGWRLKRVDLKLSENEEKDICLTLQPEKRAAIHGVVKFPEGAPVKGAIVKLFKKDGNPCELIPITFTYTDDCGQFLFGVDAGIDYVVKVFFYTPENITENKKYDRKVDCDC